MAGESEKKMQDVKAERDRMLANITFTESSYIPAFDGKIIDPSITFTKPADWVGDSVVQ